jgi:hypothetical protein
MIHGKKMVLVPFDSYNAENELPKAPAPIGDFSLMDTEMNAILKHKNLSEDDKIAKYNQVLQRYMSKLQRAKRDISVVFENSDEESENEEDDPLKNAPPAPQAPSMDSLLDRVRQSQVQRTRSEKLYQVLEKCSNIKWDVKGETKIRNKYVGNIGELIQHCMLKKPKTVLDGWDSFSVFLKNVNIPVSYVTNQQVKELLRTANPTPKVSSSLKAKTGRGYAKQKWVPYS